jgi:hypothetical protein
LCECRFEALDWKANEDAARGLGDELAKAVADFRANIETSPSILVT